VSTQTVSVKVSAASARQRFHGCELNYIRNVCKGACCRSSTAAGGTLVTIHPSEQAAVEAAGAKVQNGMIVSVRKRCPFQEKTTELCGVHDTPAKPFGCIASPFTLNSSGTLIVRNRYRSLKCFKDDRDGPAPPAYRAFRASLDIIFGADTAQRLVDHLDSGGGDIVLPALGDAHRKLIDNDRAKHIVPKGVAVTSTEVDSLDYLAEPLRSLAVDIDSLTLLPGNPRRGDVEAVARSLRAFGQRKPVVVNKDHAVLAGNHTLLAARSLGWTKVAAVFVDDDETTAKAFALADNRTGTLGGFDDTDLAAMLADVADADPALLSAASYTLADLTRLLADPAGDPATPSLADRFLIPPFSVLDARSGWWRTRKRQWLNLGIRGEVGAGMSSQDGRGEHLAYHATSANPDYYAQKRGIERKLGREVPHAEFEETYYAPTDAASVAAGTSVFDPVLCEVVYRWFSGAGAHVLDPWAGGSVRGLVATMLGRTYTGVELRPEQVSANQEQAEQLLDAVPEQAWPHWILGDSAEVLPTLDCDVDLVFGCPPYFDLETYGNDPRDLSVMGPAAFAEAYRAMVKHAANRLRPDRFMVLVVSAARDPRQGHLRDLAGLTVAAAADAGLALYNEAILITPAGSLPMRAARQFAASRILGRSHQDVLIFVKGDRRLATAACGDVDVNALADLLTDPGEPDA
jgi:hypothetical protein